MINQDNSNEEDFFENYATSGQHEDSDKSILLWNPGDIQNVVLHGGFNLHRIPKNYFTKKSYIENLVYHAITSDNLKSPFSGFKTANEYLDELNDIDVISGIKNLKSFIRSFFASNHRASIMVHRIGSTWLLDEFDIDSFLTGGHCRDWLWLREFLFKENYHLCTGSFSRKALISKDLEKKFLYHTVSESTDLGLRQLTDISPYLEEQIHENSVSHNHLSLLNKEDCSVRPVTKNNETCDNYQRKAWSLDPDKYLSTAKWQLQDLSFLVGSDLPIFGTPKHPCISLKLSPKHESINVLTGIDVWLENIVNEVPEVTMCYHHEGIVLQEYEIYKTCELPEISGFDSKQVGRILQNLIMFIKRNATQEGHTYWLVKEPGLGVVKLYDLTTLGIKEFDESVKNSTQSSRSTVKDTNPFILPVASLCYKLAERRLHEFVNLRKAQFSGLSQTDNYFDDNITNEISNVLDAMYLLRNCLNLISILEDRYDKDSLTYLPINDLKMKAILAFYKLYLITPMSVMGECFKRFKTAVSHGKETVSVSIDKFDCVVPPDGSNSYLTDDFSKDCKNTDNTPAIYTRSNQSYLGSKIIEAFKCSNMSELMQFSISLLGNPSSNNLSSDPNIDLYDSNSELTDNAQELVQYDANRHSSSNPSLFSFVMLKAAISETERLWVMTHEQLNKSKSNLLASLDNLKSIINNSLSALLLFSHLIPDQYTNALNYFTESELANSKCPFCFATCYMKSALNKDCVQDAVFPFSCLLVAAFIAYPQVIQQLDKDQLDQTKQTTFNAADSHLMQLACEQSKAKFADFINSILAGPIWLSSQENVSFESFENALNVLLITMASFHRIFRINSVQHEKTFVKGHCSTENCTKSKQWFKAYLSRLHISIDWWHVLVNMFTCTIKVMWTRFIADGSDDVCQKFNAYLTAAFNITTSNWTNSFEWNNMSAFLLQMNKFQLFKLLAAHSQQSTPNWPMADEEDSKWNRLLGCATSHHLPRMALSRVRSPRIPTTALFLAHAIEVLLGHYYNQSKTPTANNPAATPIESVSSQFYLDLITATNEYLALCLTESNLAETNGTEFLDTVNHVLKQVLSCIPPKFVPNMGDDVRRQLFTRNLSRALVNLRLYELKLAIYRHNDGTRFKKGQSEAPTWPTVISQTRFTLQWHAQQLQSHMTKDNGLTTLVSLEDVTLHLVLINYLVNLQLVNLGVMSISGLKIILRDICASKPILSMIENFKNQSSENINELVNLLKEISNNIDRVSCTLGDKVTSCRSKRKHLSQTKSADSSLALQIQAVDKLSIEHTPKGDHSNKQELKHVQKILNQKLDITSTYLQNA